MTSVVKSNNIKNTLGQYWSWAKKGGFAVMDQALFAGTNFLVSVLLARWLEPEAYGAFSTAFAVFLFVGNLHTALWTEPMLVYGSGRFREQYQQYQKILIIYHWRLGSISSVLFILVGAYVFILGHVELGRSFIGLAIASPLIFYLWLARRSAYILLQPQYAVLGGLLYMFLYFGVSLVLYKANLLSELSVLVSMGLAGYVAGYVTQKSISNMVVIDKSPFNHNELAVLKLHWKYGRWAILAGGVAWVPSNIYFIILSAINGLEASAQLKSLLNLIAPIMQFNLAIAGMLIPTFMGGIQKGILRKIALNYLVMLLASSLVYSAMLLLWGQDLAIWLYDSKFLFQRAIIVGVSFIPFLQVFISISGALVRVHEKPSFVAVGWGGAALVSIVTGLIFVPIYKLDGAVLSMLFAYFVGALILTQFAYLYIRRS